MSEHPPIPGFELLQLLGRNGHLVYLARQSNSGRLVFLNVVHSSGDFGRGVAERLRQQARLLASLDHPNILRPVEMGDAQAYGFFTALEYADGGRVADKLHAGPLPPGQAVSIARGITGALLYAQARAVIQDDLTPRSILLTGDNWPKLADFRLAGADRGKERMGIALTPAYAAPEELSFPKGGEPAPHTDVYRVGAVLYAMLTGLPPFSRGSDTREMIRQVREQSPVPVQQSNPAVPADLESVCMKCLEKSPALRYISLGELVVALGRCLVQR
ncbi:MAG: serine/threonine-protein kinase [Pirellula sp.]